MLSLPSNGKTYPVDARSAFNHEGGRLSLDSLVDFCCSVMVLITVITEIVFQGWSSIFGCFRNVHPKPCS